MFVQIVFKLLIYKLLRLMPILPFTKGKVLLTCQDGKNLLMSWLLRIYKRYDRETLKLNNKCRFWHKLVD